MTSYYEAAGKGIFPDVNPVNNVTIQSFSFDIVMYNSKLILGDLYLVRRFDRQLFHSR